MSDRVWQSFFDEHAEDYLLNGFTHNTIAECDFLIEELHLTSGSKVLDIGCGVGRHCVELARRGLIVTGLDLSAGMLRKAEQNATEAQVEVKFIQADASQHHFTGEFEAAICLCEGATGLIEHGEDPFKHDVGVIHCAASALRQNGGFLMTALNGYRAIRQATQKEVEDGLFDPVTMRCKKDESWELNGKQYHLTFEERLFTPPEMSHLLHVGGFKVNHVWGGTAGSWNRKVINLDEIEVMYVCSKQ